jgi:hypothetical protein
MNLRVISGCWDCTRADACEIGDTDLFCGTCKRWEKGVDVLWKRREEKHGNGRNDSSVGNIE